MGQCKRISSGRSSKGWGTMKKPQKLISFNEDNTDILDLLNNKSNASQYVCEAVRFYDQYKTMVNNMAQIEKKLDMIASKLEGISVSTSNDDKPSPIDVLEENVHVRECIDNDLKNLILSEED